MDKSKFFKGKAVVAAIASLKNNTQYILLAVVIINLLYLCTYTNSKINYLKENENRLESEVLSLRAMIQKETLAAEESANVRYEALQKVYSLSLEQTKTISQIPTDNAFFKKWLLANHDETKKNIEEAQNKLILIQKDIKNLNNKISSLEFRDNKSVPISVKENVEAISL